MSMCHLRVFPASTTIYPSGEITLIVIETSLLSLDDHVFPFEFEENAKEPTLLLKEHLA